MTPANLKQAVRSVLLEERMLDSLADRCPPPNDVEAERIVLSALVSGEVDQMCADELDDDDFFLPLHRWVFARFRDGARTAERILGLAEKERMIGPRASRELELLAVGPPVGLALPMSRWMARVKEASHRRTIYRVSRDVATGLATETMTSDEARAALRRVAT